jgi:hypothetical protein
MKMEMIQYIRLDQRKNGNKSVVYSEHYGIKSIVVHCRPLKYYIE